MSSRDLDSAIAVTRDVYWVGRHDPETSLHCNAYLLVDEQDVVLIDPGSIPDFHVVMRKVLDVVDPAEVTAIVASHQDPDVCSNLVVVEEILRGEVKVVATENTARLIRALGLRSQIYEVGEHGYRMVLRSGRELEFIPTPFLHAPGAMITFDAKTRTAFTSDLFGGISESWSLFADTGFLDAMTTFHQLYMPTNALLRACMERLEGRGFERICPQHGSILEGAQVAQAIEHLKELRCGLDLAEAPNA